jgi:hypothetical protein
MSWGLKKADDKNLPTFVESTAIGEKLYAQSGFEMVRQIDVDFSGQRSDEEWIKATEQFPAIPILLLCRPAANAS